jgi:transposase
MELTLTTADRADLERVIRATSTPAGIARRARCVLLLADGHSYSAVCAALGVTDRFVARWKRRFAAGGVLALADDARAGRQDHRLSPAVEARILRITREERPPTPLTHWTSRRLAARVGVSNGTVLRVWRRAGLKPHRLARYVATTDPEFETKAADIIALYLDPPEHAVVLCWMRRRRSRPWTASTRCCRSRLAAPSATASSTSGTGRSRCTPRSK